MVVRVWSRWRCVVVVLMFLSPDIILSDFQTSPPLRHRSFVCAHEKPARLHLLDTVFNANYSNTHQQQRRDENPHICQVLLHALLPPHHCPRPIHDVIRTPAPHVDGPHRLNALVHRSIGFEILHIDRRQRQRDTEK